ncbi:MAG: carboxypeptidase-like regulatory domain-containing protein [Cytophagales bacterium]|nr:MAG: carboxypeptidase-like regulatory domain-containing protein [Cytophagales bacterium]
MSLVKLALLTLIAYSLTVFFVHAQTAPVGSVGLLTGRIQSTDNQPLAYVSIGIPGTPVGTVSTEAGTFSLTLKPETAPTDSVRFSILGYAPLTLTVASLRQRLETGQALSLTETARQLAEVRIKPVPGKTIGNQRVATNMNTNLMLNSQPSQNLGSEVGRRFNLPGRTVRLTQYRAYVESNFEGVTLRINVYEARSMKPLLNRNVYVKITGKHSNWIEVDLEPLNLVAEGDVVASVQWVDSEGKGSYLGLPIQMPAFATHMYKYGSQNKWKTFRGMSTAMTLAFSPVDKDDVNAGPESLTLAK